MKPASSETPKPNDPNDRREATNGADTNYPNPMNNTNGKGSPYGGTQSPDSTVPDGNQTPPDPNAQGKSTTPPELGEEYDSESSYGDAENGGKTGEDTGTDAAGSPIR